MYRHAQFFLSTFCGKRNLQEAHPVFALFLKNILQFIANYVWRGCKRVTLAPPTLSSRVSAGKELEVIRGNAPTFDAVGTVFQAHD